jgi:protein-tyrosine phosphatase
MMFDFDAIDDTLIVGSAFRRDDVRLLVELGVRAVVSLQAEACDPEDALAEVGILCARVECEDFHAPTPAQMLAAVDAVEGFIAEGRRVYLHCFAGLQRSVTIAACCLIRRDPTKWNARTALARIGVRRRNACPTYEQMEAVLLFDRMTRESRGMR